MTPRAQIGIIGYGSMGRDLCDRLSRAAAPTPVTARVIADTAISLNKHEIEAESVLGAAFMRFANRPSSDNTETSALTAASLAAAVRRLLEQVGP